MLLYSLRKPRRKYILILALKCINFTSNFWRCLFVCFLIQTNSQPRACQVGAYASDLYPWPENFLKYCCCLFIFGGDKLAQWPQSSLESDYKKNNWGTGKATSIHTIIYAPQHCSSIFSSLFCLFVSLHEWEHLKIMQMTAQNIPLDRSHHLKRCQLMLLLIIYRHLKCLPMGWEMRTFINSAHRGLRVWPLPHCPPTSRSPAWGTAWQPCSLGLPYTHCSPPWTLPGTLHVTLGQLPLTSWYELKGFQENLRVPRCFWFPHVQSVVIMVICSFQLCIPGSCELLMVRISFCTLCVCFWVWYWDNQGWTQGLCPKLYHRSF